MQGAEARRMLRAEDTPAKHLRRCQNEPSTYLRQRGQAARQAQALAQRGVTGAGEESVRRCGGGGSHRGLQQRRKVG